MGARVFTTCGTAEKAAFCRSLGADVVINYRENDFVDVIKQESLGAGADIILDNMGSLYMARNMEASAMDGQIVVIGLQGGKAAGIDLSIMMEKRMSLHVTSLRDRPLSERARILKGVQRDIWPMVSEGLLRPVVDRVFPFDDVIDAHRHAESVVQKGKVLLQLCN
ncbi:zinc-binding dehydrogenase (plasmid) [Arthrobacter sp. UC242_113]|uniref:zinc-binding dehydrogenase n=1 Tax=Arthrobacter sp. UC242_113 TaxID=3374550 RepID=UPI0037583812